MINETLSNIESAIAKVQAGNSAEKAELVALLNKLKLELSTLPASKLDAIRSVGYFTEAAAREAVKVKF